VEPLTEGRSLSGFSGQTAQHKRLRFEERQQSTADVPRRSRQQNRLWSQDFGVLLRLGRHRPRLHSLLGDGVQRAYDLLFQFIGSGAEAHTR